MRHCSSQDSLLYHWTYLITFYKVFLMLGLENTHTHKHTHTHTHIYIYIWERESTVVVQSCPNLCNLMDCSMPVFPVLHRLLEFVQTHVHWVSDTIQPSHPLLPPSSLALNLSQHQGLFQWMSQLFTSGGQSIRASASASVLLMNIQDWFPLGLTGLISLQSKGLSRVFSNTTVQNRHQFFSVQLSLWSNSHIHIWLLEKP